MREWFQSQIDWHVIKFGQVTGSYYFIEVHPVDEFGIAKMEVLTVLEHELDTLNEQWAFVQQDDRSLLPKLTRKNGDQ